MGGVGGVGGWGWGLGCEDGEGDRCFMVCLGLASLVGVVMRPGLALGKGGWGVGMEFGLEHAGKGMDS